MRGLIQIVSSAILVLLTFITVFSQDVIIDREGETIDCAVIAVNDKSVVYRANDKAHSILKEKVMIIYYGNGTQQTFEQNNTVTPKPAETVKEEAKKITTAADDTFIEIKRGKYYKNGNRIKQREVIKLIRERNCPEAQVMLKKARGAGAVNIIGNVLICFGAGYTLYNAVTFYDADYITGSAIALGGLTFAIIGSGVKNNRIEDAVDEYNKCLAHSNKD
jgi:hypothetical protein